MSDRTPTEPTGPTSSLDGFRPKWVLGWAGVAVVALIVLGIAWFSGGSTELLGVLGALAIGALAVICHHLVVTQDAGERAAARTDTHSDDIPIQLPRRHLLLGAIGVTVIGALGFFGLRRFGPHPPQDSAWHTGAALVTVDGQRVRPSDVPLGGVVTVWPQGHAGTERAAVMLLRLRDEPLAPTRTDGVVDGTLVAYSRLCTHAGCAVALYRDHDQALFCPCHQATFDARRGAEPVSGPASVALPQLPLALASEGHLIAAGDLTARPGPVGGTA